MEAAIRFIHSTICQDKVLGLSHFFYIHFLRSQVGKADIDAQYLQGQRLGTSGFYPELSEYDKRMQGVAFLELHHYCPSHHGFATEVTIGRQQCKVASIVLHVGNIQPWKFSPES